MKQYTVDRTFRLTISRWLRTVKALWPECPAAISKDGKVVIVHEAPTFGGFGGEIAATIADEAFYSLDAPIKRVGAPFTPVPVSPILEKFYLPNAEKIVQAAKEIQGMGSKPAAWVASDALRELTSEKVQERLRA